MIVQDEFAGEVVEKRSAVVAVDIDRIDRTQVLDWQTLVLV